MITTVNVNNKDLLSLTKFAEAKFVKYFLDNKDEYLFIKENPKTVKKSVFGIDINYNIPYNISHKDKLRRVVNNDPDFTCSLYDKIVEYNRLCELSTNYKTTYNLDYKFYKRLIKIATYTGEIS